MSFYLSNNELSLMKLHHPIYLIWLFPYSFFCEKNMLSLFLDIMRPGGKGSAVQAPVPVLIQILQTMGILCQCVKNDTSLYYILSNNYINEFLSFPYDFDNDEVLDQFVSFLKSLSLRIDEHSIQFFFIEKTRTMPILARAIELLRYREGMVRIAAQTTILNIYRVKDERARSIFLQDEVMHGLFSQIGPIYSIFLTQQILNINGLLIL